MSIDRTLESVAAATGELAGAIDAFPSLTDSALLDAQAMLSAARRRIDAAVAASSAEIARRSHRDLGYDGLAQRLGARTPERLVQQVSGVSRREASSLVRVGALDASSPLAEPVASGDLSVEAADLIGTVLSSASAPPSDIASAAQRLAGEAALLALEQLASRARAERDDLDASGVIDREQSQRDSRYLRLSRQLDGMVRVTGLLDPESAALVTDAFDAVTSPRRGGPRFVDPAAREWSLSVENDSRTLDQLTADTFVDIVRIAVGADTERLFGQRRPAVRVVVAERDLRDERGLAHLEGGATVSLATAARLACEAGIQPLVVDSAGEALRLGRAQRLFSAAQRIVLAARDGGCRFPGCDRPPSWTEAHHITPWSRGGRTDVSDGILLCRHHHLLVHNNGWQIRQCEHGFEAVPPVAIDSDQVPLPMRSVSRAWSTATGARSAVAAARTPR